MSGEFIVHGNDSFRKVEYLIKKELKEKTDLTVIAGIYSAMIATQVSEHLQKLGYVTLGNVSTYTKVSDGKRRITLAIKLLKTQDFDKKYEEYEAIRQKNMEERNKRFEGNNNYEKNNN